MNSSIKDRVLLAALGALLAASTACGDSGTPTAVSTVSFDLDGPLTGATFWEFPFPSDMRLTADGVPDVAGYPNPAAAKIVDDLLTVAKVRKGFPVMPVGYFRFTDAPPARISTDVIAASKESPVLIVDIDPNSAEKGTLYAAVAQTLTKDAFAPDHLVAVAPRPGTVLAPSTMYAIVIKQEFAPDATAPAAFAALAAGKTPSGARAAAAAALYAPMWTELDTLGVSRSDVLVATVFTTGDEVKTLRDRSELVRAAYTVDITNITVQPNTNNTHPGFCALTATVSMPQFQNGVAPYDTGGDIQFDANGAPIKTGDLTVPLMITLPSSKMPAEGFPLWQYFHGSGQVTQGLVDYGPSTISTDEDGAPGQGPASVVAPFGIAAVACAMPVNPERLVNASETAYLNINNLTAFPYVFQQGTYEQRLLLDALLKLKIPSSVIADCPDGLALPDGVTSFSFNSANLMSGGHSMGGMYDNMISAIEPRYNVMTPFGAGGMWPVMILDTADVPGSRDLLASIFRTDADQLSFMHPGLFALAMGWEIADPMASMARIIRRPLAGFVPRSVYEPVGFDDIYFPTDVYDATALAYGNQEGGDIVWPDTQASLATDGLDGILPYPITANHTNAVGPKTTNVVVQYMSDGILESHQIYRQLPAVKHQYGCFLSTYLKNGIPTVPSQGDIGTPCDQ